VDHSFDEQRVAAGLRRMAWGLFKKVVVADRVAVFADVVYTDPSAYHGLALVVATCMFAFQIYLDFSAYSDIALGSAQVLGFRLMENFDRPYLSTSVSEFWRRWHISLSTWFKDYLYVPLGGSRVSFPLRARNLLIVFLVSGLWHGANWTFVIWGGLHGCFLIAGHLTAPLRARIGSWLPRAAAPVRRLGALLTTFSLVTFAWIFFRARNTSQAWYVATHLFQGLGADVRDVTHGGSGGLPAVPLLPRCALLALVLAIERLGGRWSDLDAFVRRRSPFLRFALYLGVVYAAILGGGEGSAQQFIYFQF
jgi:D-alanyl-lipoteichoic acid acyltransferase DltB (MBOAT superfamily)